MFLISMARIPQEVQLNESLAGTGLVGDTLVLIESSGSDESLDALRLEKFITAITASEDGKALVEDAVLSMDSQQELVNSCAGP
jgi:hypothetical protein